MEASKRGMGDWQAAQVVPALYWAQRPATCRSLRCWWRRSRGAAQGCVHEERPEALQDLNAKLVVPDKDMEARANVAQIAGRSFTHSERA